MKNKIKILESKANEVRKLIVKMLAEAKSGHPGGSLSSTEIITCLYFDIMNVDPENPDMENRDKFHLSKGHCCPALYAVLSLKGYFPLHELMNLRKLGSFLQGHPDIKTPGVEVGSGSLGQGLSIALGMALAAKLDNKEQRVYCLMGDGEVQEGNIWEAAMAAAQFKADNLCGILDNNGFQIDGRIEEVMGLEPLADKWKAFGWNVIRCDGHNIEQLLHSFEEAKRVKFKPSIIIARTVKGKGVSFMEHVVDFHGRSPTDEEKVIALDELKRIKK